MRSFQGLTLGVAALALALAATAAAAGPKKGPKKVTGTTTTYVVVGASVPGVSTGLVLDGNAVTVTATGAVCPSSSATCPGPNGDPDVNTTTSPYGGFPAPGEPAWGLVARVGTGPWTHVGSGPTLVSGTGVLEFAVNDDYLGDNTGNFTATVSWSVAGCGNGKSKN